MRGALAVVISNSDWSIERRKGNSYHFIRSYHSRVTFSAIRV